MSVHILLVGESFATFRTYMRTKFIMYTILMLFKTVGVPESFPADITAVT